MLKLVFLSLILFCGQIQKIQTKGPKNGQNEQLLADSDEQQKKHQLGEESYKKIMSSSTNSNNSTEFFDAYNQFDESQENVKNKQKRKKAFYKKVLSPKVMKFFRRNEKLVNAASHSIITQENGKLEESNESESDDCMECPICFDHVKYDQLCFCDHLMADQIFGSSSTSETQNESHAFCIECLKNYTDAAHEMAPFAKGGVGLSCMAQNCENPIPWPEIKKLLPNQLKSIQALENRCDELCVAMAGLCLLRCAKCNCAVEIDPPPPTDNDTKNNGKLKFNCPECHYEMCRKCNLKWADEHNDLTCEQFTKQQNKEEFLMEKRFTEIAIHKCAKCYISFVKYEGCNHVICRNKNCFSKYCYCCRMSDVDKSTHYCRCYYLGEQSRLNLDSKNCSKCKKCHLHVDVIKLEQKEMERIKKEFEEENEKKSLENEKKTTNKDKGKRKFHGMRAI